MVPVYEPLQEAERSWKEKNQVSSAAIATSPTIKYSRELETGSHLSTHSSDVTSRHFYTREKEAIPVECGQMSYFQQLSPSLPNHRRLHWARAAGVLQPEAMLSIHIIKQWLPSEALPAGSRTSQIKVEFVFVVVFYDFRASEMRSQ